jgi:hypothetical protein
MTGDDGASFAAAVAGGTPELRRGLDSGVSVAYTALAHPGAWQASPTSFPENATYCLTGLCADCFSTLFPGQSLDDSYAIMGYDAIMTAVRLVRSPNGPIRTPGALIQQFKQLHGDSAAPGASGWISLTPEGRTINKAVVIMGVEADGRSTFRELSSPYGAACKPGVPPC